MVATRHAAEIPSGPALIDEGALCSDFGDFLRTGAIPGVAAPSDDSTSGSVCLVSSRSSAPASPAQLSPRLVELAPEALPSPMHLALGLDAASDFGAVGRDEPMTVSPKFTMGRVVAPIAASDEPIAVPLPEAPPSTDSGAPAARAKSPCMARGNDGSTGHPYFCSRPCMFFASGACANTGGCTYCHVPHQKRPTHLDKRSRACFENLTPASRLGLLLSLVRQRLLHLELLDEVQALVDELVDACGLEDCSWEKGRWKKIDGRLRSALTSIDFRPLLVMIGRIVEDPKVAAATHTLMTRCRELYDARGSALHVAV